MPKNDPFIELKRLLKHADKQVRALSDLIDTIEAEQVHAHLRTAYAHAFETKTAISGALAAVEREYIGMRLAQYQMQEMK